MAYQVSIFLENRPGHFRRVTTVLKREGINIRTMTLSTTSLGWGVLNLIVDNPVKAHDALSKQNFSVKLRKVVVLKMDDTPGGLDGLLEKLENTGINIENAYGRIVKEKEKAYLAIDVENIDEAESKLREAGLEFLDDEVVYGNNLN